MVVIETFAFSFVYFFPFAHYCMEGAIRLLASVRLTIFFYVPCPFVFQGLREASVLLFHPLAVQLYYVFHLFYYFVCGTFAHAVSST